MLLGFIKPAIGLILLRQKTRYLPFIPLLNKFYREDGRIRDRLKMTLLKSRLQEHLIKKIFGGSAIGVLFDTTNGLLINDPGDVTVTQSLGFNGAYDKEKVEYLMSLIDESKCVHVIGAHIGEVAIPLARKVREVVAFEANPLAFELLSKNILLNRVCNIKAYNYAVYDEEKEITFYRGRANTGGSKIKPFKDHYWYNYDDPEIITVAAKILDVQVSDSGISLPDLIVMDIEGAEYAALKGAGACLQHASYLYIEFMPHHLSNIANISVEQFSEVVTTYFQNMIIVNWNIGKSPRSYSNDQMLHVLKNLFNHNRGVDLLFYKSDLNDPRKG